MSQISVKASKSSIHELTVYNTRLIHDNYDAHMHEDADRQIRNRAVCMCV